MKKVSRRALFALALAIVLAAGTLAFCIKYAVNADKWVTFSGSPHVYTGTNLTGGKIYDRTGARILNTTDGRVYSSDAAVRAATVHLLGDRYGYISAPLLGNFAEQMIGYDKITGLSEASKGTASARLTISADVQKAALQALGSYHGTVGVYNYKTGEILCAVTSPSYDPDNIPDIAGDETGDYDGVYLNRFFDAAYTPGSIFKLVTSAAALEADRKLVVKPRGEDDLPAHFAQRRDLVFQIPALRILVDRLIQDLLNLRDIVLAVFRLHAQDDRLGGVGVQKRGNVAQHVIECERSGKRGVGGLAARDAVLEHQRLLVVLLFEHQTHIQIAVAVDQLRGNARVLTLKNVAHIHILRAAVVRTRDRHIAELCLVRHGFHPVGTGDVRCHGRRRGDPGKDGKHHADEQRAEPEAVFGGLHKVFSSSFLCRTSIPCGGRVPPV